MVDGSEGPNSSPVAELGPGSFGPRSRRPRLVAASVALVSVLAIVVAAAIAAPGGRSRVRSTTAAAPSGGILAVVSGASTEGGSSTSVGGPSAGPVSSGAPPDGPSTAAPPRRETGLVVLDPANGNVVDTIDPNVVVNGPRSMSITRDGQHAFVARVTHACSGEQRPTTDLVEYSLGDKTSKVVAADAGNPVVRPDGSRVAYSRTPCVGAGARPVATLVVHDLVGSTADVTFDALDPIAFSPDGAQLLVRDRMQRYELLSITDAAQSPTPLAAPEGLDLFGWIGAAMTGVDQTGVDHATLVPVDTPPQPAGKPILEFSTSLELVDFDESESVALLLERAGDRTLKRQRGTDLADIVKHVDAAKWIPHSSTTIPSSTTTASPTTTAKPAPSTTVPSGTDTIPAATPSEIMAVTSDGRVVQMAADGTVQRTIADPSNGRRADGVTVSPDGKTLIASYRTGCGVGYHDLRVISLDGTSSLLTSLGLGNGASVSPDGTTLAYEEQLQQPQPTSCDEGALILRDLATGTERRIDPASLDADVQHVRPVGWLDARHLVVYSFYADAAGRTYDVDVHATPVTSRRVPIEGRFGVRVLGDSGSLVGSDRRGDNVELVVMDPVTGGEQRTFATLPWPWPDNVILTDTTSSQSVLFLRNSAPPDASHVDLYAGHDLYRVDAGGTPKRIASGILDAVWGPGSSSNPTSTTATSPQPS